MKIDLEEIKLPPKEELLVYVPLSPLQRYSPCIIEANRRFWYKRMITRLDTAALNDVVGTTQPIKPEFDAEDKEEPIIAEQRRLQVKLESAEVAPQQVDETTGNAWQKLMNLLMQLRKICDQ